MATTFEITKGMRRANYCTLPSKDVEVLPNIHRCDKCGDVIEYRVPENDWWGKWFHVTEPEDKHYCSPRTQCPYCRTDDPDEVTHVQAAWSDEVRCTRCGGTHGFAIGD